MTNQTQTRDSFIFYRSFFETISDLEDKEQLQIYKAIAELSLNDNLIKLDGLAKTIFRLIEPQLLANKKRYLNGLKGAEHGSKGGRPKSKNNPKETPRKPLNNPKKTPNITPNKNKNENVNENKKCKLELELPNFINKNLFDGFVEMRNKIKKPLTDKAKELLIKKLTAFENKQAGFANKALENSIEGSWQGIFEPRPNNNLPQQPKQNTFARNDDYDPFMAEIKFQLEKRNNGGSNGK